MQLKFEPMAFPVITICNLNPYKKSGVATRPDLTDLVGRASLTSHWRGTDGLAFQMTKYIKAANHTLNDTDDTYGLNVSLETSVRS